MLVSKSKYTRIFKIFLSSVDTSCPQVLTTTVLLCMPDIPRHLAPMTQRTPKRAAHSQESAALGTLGTSPGSKRQTSLSCWLGHVLGVCVGLGGRKERTQPLLSGHICIWPLLISNDVFSHFRMWTHKLVLLPSSLCSLSLFLSPCEAGSHALWNTKQSGHFSLPCFSDSLFCLFHVRGKSRQQTPSLLYSDPL